MSDLIASTTLWSPEEQEILARIARLVIGDDPEGLMPAVDESILAQVFNRATGFERPIRRGFGVLEKVCEGDVASQGDESLTALMEAHPELRSMLRAMMQVVAQCYYEDARVLAALGFEARPPFPAGHELEEGDWSLLDPVRARGPA